MAEQSWFSAPEVPNRPPPRRYSRQIGRVERFTCVLTGAGRSCPGRSDSGRKKVLFDTDNLHETPEFWHRGGGPLMPFLVWGPSTGWGFRRAAQPPRNRRSFLTFAIHSPMLPAWRSLGV